MSPTGLYVTFCVFLQEKHTFLVRGDLSGPHSIILTTIFIFIVGLGLVGPRPTTVLSGTVDTVIIVMGKGGDLCNPPVRSVELLLICSNLSYDMVEKTKEGGETIKPLPLCLLRRERVESLSHFKF
eukprot:TRINITY_DN2452_c1_g1_i1.p1 TRINITY_DN2452_c1_g1~~TRINITY_DN2452_c1_g1_i1.p1  ORF type:complete len:126 (-),score=16.30 TRINITY_DN2452_c1_g1_i1:911-1288(-)